MALPNRPMPVSANGSEGKVQLFLERAEAIILENRSLTAELWRKLALLAAELELPDEQFRMVLDELIERGVIDRTVERPLGPPPLPVPPTDPVRKRPEIVQEVGFALTAPPGCDVGQGPISRSSITATLPPPKPPSQAVADSDSTISALRESSPRSRPLRTKVDANEVSNTPIERVVGRWRVEGEPTPAPLEPIKKPADTYLDFLRQSFDYITGGVVSIETEHRLYYHGTRVLALSPVFARQLLDQVAAERTAVFASESAAQAELSDSTFASTPPADAASRPSSPELVLAKTDDSNVGSLEQKRLAPFRDYVSTMLERIPPGILSIQLLNKLTSAGVDLYGVARETALDAIRQLSRERQIEVLTQDEAEAKLNELVVQMVADDLWLTGEQREYVRLAGTKWGLPLSRIDAVADEASRVYRVAYRREQAMTRLALVAASFALLLVLCFLGYVFLGGRQRSHFDDHSPPATPVTRPKG